MEKKRIKCLKTIIWEKNVFKSFFYINKLKRFRTDINFELFEINSDEKFVKNEKNLNKTHLVVIGLNWKLIKACDIFAFLKPFEYQKGGLKRVSIISNKFISTKKVILDEIESNFKYVSSETRRKFGNIEGSPEIYALVECASNKNLKELYKKCNGIEIGNDRDIIDMRLATMGLIKCSYIIESVDQIPKNYFPQYLKSSFFLKKESRLIPKKLGKICSNIKKSYSSPKKFIIESNFNRKKKNHKNIFFNLLNFHLENKNFLINKINEPYGSLKILSKNFFQRKKL
jgi:hypothetical protein